MTFNPFKHIETMRNNIFTQLLTVTALVFVTLMSCSKGDDGENSAKWTLTWEENFDGSSLDATKWSKIGRGTSDWNLYMSNHASLVEVTGGELILRGIVNTVDGGDAAAYLTGGVQTAGKVPFRGGRLEIKAKLQGAQGAWPAIWMMPFISAPWPDGGEIDIMERLNHDGYVYQSIHSDYANTLGQTTPKKSATAAISPNDYNVYAVEMYADSLSFYVNDKHTFSYPKIKTPYEGQFPFDRDYFLMIDMQLGGSWVGAINNAQLPVEMRIDWVRFYKK
jgi:beta-glucanase (GH16 family)